MDNFLLLAAIMLCVSGMAWLALAMDVHWKQVNSGALPAQSVRSLRITGYSALFGSLVWSITPPWHRWYGSCCSPVPH